MGTHHAGRLMSATLGCAAIAALGLAGTASAAEPTLTVPKAKLAAALHCQASVSNATRTPVLIIPPTGISSDEFVPPTQQKALTGAGIPTCYVELPEFTTGNIQTSAQYVVSATRAMAKRAGRPIAMFGLSQGGLLIRYGLTYWPSLQPLVTDAVMVSGPQHGSTVYDTLLVPCQPNCQLTAAAWQQAAGSQLLTALNAHPDETPGRVSYTTIRTTADNIATPQTGPHPTSALKGATNLVIQDVCPGRATTHFESGVDSVAYAALIDAITHPGAAKTSRLPSDVCAHLFAPGLVDADVHALLDELTPKAFSRILLGGDGTKLLAAEPPLKAYPKS